MSMSVQAADHRDEIIRKMRAAQSHGIHSLDAESRTRIFNAQVMVGDWNRAHTENRILPADILLPTPDAVITALGK